MGEGIEARARRSKAVWPANPSLSCGRAMGVRLARLRRPRLFFNENEESFHMRGRRRN